MTPVSDPHLRDALPRAPGRRINDDLHVHYLQPSPGSARRGPHGNLYGPIWGEILRLATDGTVSTAFVSGAGPTPSSSYSNLVEDAAGNLSDLFGDGPSLAILRLDPSSDFSTFFTYDPGDSPNGDLLLGTDGNLYGLTRGDGVASFGTVYRIDSGGTRTILHTFTGLDGSFPAGGLAEGPGLEFFGATGRGGANGHGTLFKVHANGTFTSLHEARRLRWPRAGYGLALAGDGRRSWHDRRGRRLRARDRVPD